MNIIRLFPHQSKELSSDVVRIVEKILEKHSDELKKKLKQTLEEFLFFLFTNEEVEVGENFLNGMMEQKLENFLGGLKNRRNKYAINREICSILSKFFKSCSNEEMFNKDERKKREIEYLLQIVEGETEILSQVVKEAALYETKLKTTDNQRIKVI